MINVFEDTPAEKEQCILDLIEKGHTYKDIMEECHVSPSTISKVNKARLGYTEDSSSGQAGQLSKETQALKLFNEGKKPIDVAIELDIATDFVFTIYQNFQRLRNMGAFISSYEHVKGNIIPYLHLFDLMNNLGLTPEQVQEQVKYGYDLPNLRSTHSALSNEILALESQKQCVYLQLNFFRNQLEQCKGAVEFYQNEYDKKGNELFALCSEINTKKKLIQNFDNEEGYIRIKDAAKKETKLLIQDNQISCAVTLSATLEAIRRYPDNQNLISDIISSGNYSTSSNKLSLHASQLLRLMQNVQNEIAEQMSVVVAKSMMNTDKLNDDPDTNIRLS